MTETTDQGVGDEQADAPAPAMGRAHADDAVHAGGSGEAGHAADSADAVDRAATTGPVETADSDRSGSDGSVSDGSVSDEPGSGHSGSTDSGSGHSGSTGTVSGGSSADAASGDAASDDAAGSDDEHDELIAEGDAAGDYLERLLDILDYDGDIDLDVEGERAVVSIVGEGDVEKLVGDRGEVLTALQELTRLAAGMETGRRSRLMLDVAGYRARRRAELTALGRRTAEQVVSSGESVTLGAMNPFERKVVHDAVASVGGATSASTGEEPRRRVVVSPAA